MLDDQCVPMQIALRLLDPSSLGLARRQGEFEQTYDELQDALKLIVNGTEEWLYFLFIVSRRCTKPLQNIIKASTALSARFTRSRPV